ncbi:MAG: hypothetical protein H0V01_15570 [Bacteroidetes bacterium]|nr:hypothetical protein [Bacteroidota bacterium]HET6244884.1 hypothetical protein [Bacteroidia bacterium]
MKKEIKVPMIFIELLIILFIAFIVSGMFYYIFKSKSNCPGNVLLFFVVIFLASVAERLWIIPVGPVFFGLAWVPILIVGAIFAFVLYAASMSPVNYKSVEKKYRNNE